MSPFVGAVLSHNILYQMAIDIGEAKAAALIEIIEFLVIDAEEVEDGGLEIVDMDCSRREGAFVRADGVSIGIGNVVAVIISATVSQAWFDTATGEPDAKATRMMIATVIVFGKLALGIAGTSELTAPDHEGIVEHTALFKILDECRTGLIGLVGLVANTRGQIAVVIPALMIKLNEAHAAFGQAPSEKAVGGKRTGFAA